jgi:nucleoside 2-deoxyribosyltransferase
MKIYLANGLFSEADYNYNEYLADKFIELGYDVYAPQRNTAINDKTKSATSIQIYDGDTNELDSADILVAVLDGIAIDPGVAAEVGYFSAKGKTIYGLYTDSRESSKTQNPAKVKALGKALENQFSYSNLYVVGAVKKYGNVFLSSKDLFKHLKKISK